MKYAGISFEKHRKHLILLSVSVLLIMIVGLSILNSLNLGTQVNTVVVEVDYPHPWSGFMTINGVQESMHANGPMSRVLTRPVGSDIWQIEVSAQKLDNTHDVMTIRIWDKYDELIEKVLTMNPYDTVAISVNL